MDTSLFFLINKGMQNSLLDYLLPFLSKNFGMIYLVIAVFFGVKDWRKVFLVSLLCLSGLAVSDAGGNVLKHYFEVPRPCQSLEDVRLLVGCGRAFSFPSNHAANAFVVAAIFGHFFRRAALPMFSVAFFVALARVYMGVHFPSDVVAGAVWAGIVTGIILFVHKWSSERFKDKPYTTVLSVSLLVIAALRFYVLFISPVDLSPDEAHYWEWSRRLDLSYYSKGPLIAYIIAFSTWLFGNTDFGVRFFAPIFIVGSSVFIYLLSIELFDDVKKSSAAALIFQFIPIFAIYGLVNTTDSPLLFFWTVALYLFWKAINRSDDDHLFYNYYLWILLGLALGLGLLAKYTMAFFYLSAVCFLAFSREHRPWLRRKEFYLAIIISLVLFSPVVIWNAQHGWIAIKHAAGQAHVSDGVTISFKYFFNFIGSQLGILTPFLFFILMIGAIKNYTSPTAGSSSRYLFWFWAPALVFFLIKSLQGKVQANWAHISYITVLIAAVDYYLSKDKMKKGLVIFIGIALFLSFTVSVFMNYPTALNLPVKIDPSVKLRGWKELGIKTGEIYDEMISSGSKNVFIFSSRYQFSSSLAFYVPGNPVTYCINLGRRMNQYDLWEGFEKLIGYDAIMVRKGKRALPEEVKAAFDSFEKESLVVSEKGKVIREYSIYKCYGFKGLKQSKIESY